MGREGKEERYEKIKIKREREWYKIKKKKSLRSNEYYISSVERTNITFFLFFKKKFFPL
mgnify:CR=1 FL=1